VDDVGAGDGGLERSLDAPRREDAADAKRPDEARVRPPGNPRGRSRQRCRLSGAGRMRDVLDRPARLGRPPPELPRQERVGGLIGRKVRRDVNDVHDVTHAQ
jgi:hypothetical protein